MKEQQRAGEPSVRERAQDRDRARVEWCVLCTSTRKELGRAWPVIRRRAVAEFARVALLALVCVFACTLILTYNKLYIYAENLVDKNKNKKKKQGFAIIAFSPDKTPRAVICIIEDQCCCRCVFRGGINADVDRG